MIRHFRVHNYRCLENFDLTLSFELPADFKELRVAEERLSCNQEDVFSRDRAQVMLSRSETEREAKFRVDWHLVALPVIQEQSPSDPLYIFRNWLARMLILAPIPRNIQPVGCHITQPGGDSPFCGRKHAVTVVAKSIRANPSASRPPASNPRRPGRCIDPGRCRQMSVNKYKKHVLVLPEV